MIGLGLNRRSLAFTSWMISSVLLSGCAMAQNGSAVRVVSTTSSTKSSAVRPATGFQLPPPSDSIEALRRAYFAYDRSLSLAAKRTPLDSTVNAKRYLVSYDSAHDQRVTAILVIPRRFALPAPAVLMLHGSGGNKDADYMRALGEQLAALGYVSLSIDAQYRGDRARPGKVGELRPDSYISRDAWIQTVIDLRRGVDLLQSLTEVDGSKIGFLGFSLGAMQGGVLGGVEDRIGCFCLTVPGGGILEAAKNLDQYPWLKKNWPVQMTPETLTRVSEIANVIDPIYYVGHILPRPLLIIVANQDEVMPPIMSRAIVEAAHADEKENVLRLDSGHAAITALFPIRRFFQKNLGARKPLTASK